MNLKLAYLSRGQLYFKNGDLAARPIVSQFGQDIINRTLQHSQRREWKTQGATSPFSGSMLWGVSADDPKQLRVAIAGMTNALRDGELLFVLETDAVGGLFFYNWAKDEERRLFHKESLRIRDLDVHPDSKLIACARYYPTGTASLAIVRGNDLQAVTEGDAVDEAPTWIPGTSRQLVFQSAGIARNAQGYALGLGPYAIRRLDLDTGTLTTVLENPQFDYLLPHMTADGTLYVIRRPYEKLGRPAYTLDKLVSDIALFPFRLLRALFHFLNFISLTFSRKPLTTAAGPQVEGDDEKHLILRGKLIDANKALREGQQNETPALVPPAWELVRRDPTGSEQVLAKGVVAFDLDLNGDLVYSNGIAVYRLSRDAAPELLFKGKLIEDLLILR